MKNKVLTMGAVILLLVSFGCKTGMGIGFDVKKNGGLSVGCEITLPVPSKVVENGNNK